MWEERKKEINRQATKGVECPQCMMGKAHRGTWRNLLSKGDRNIIRKLIKKSIGYWKTYCGKNANSNYNQTVIFKSEYNFLSIKLEMIGKIKLLNWIPTKSVPEWLNKLTGTHSFIGYLEILQGAPRKEKRSLLVSFFFLVYFTTHTYFQLENLWEVIRIKFLWEHVLV